MTDTGEPVAYTLSASAEFVPGFRMPDVFISHASEDAIAANPVCALLEARGISCWIAPRDIPLGAQYQSAIFDAITESTLLLVLCSPNACGSSHIIRELEVAARFDKDVIPVRLDNAEPNGGLAYMIAGMQRYDFRHGVGSNGDLLFAISERLARSSGDRAALKPELDQLFQVFLAGGFTDDEALRRVRGVERPLADILSGKATGTLALLYIFDGFPLFDAPERAVVVRPLLEAWVCDVCQYLEAEAQVLWPEPGSPVNGGMDVVSRSWRVTRNRTNSDVVDEDAASLEVDACLRPGVMVYGSADVIGGTIAPWVRARISR